LGGGDSTSHASVGTRGVKKQASFLDSLQQESSIAKSVGSSLGKLGSTVGMAAIGIGALAAGISLATEGLKQFGGFLISDVIKPAFALETFSTQLENSTFGSIKAADVMAKGREMQLKYNMSAMEAAETINTLADKTGNAKVAFESMDQMAALSKGYGVDMGQMADMAGAFYKQDQTLNANQLMGIIRTQLAQGGAGSITLKEIAGLSGSYTTNMGKMAGDVNAKAASLGAAMQTGGITGKADVSIGNINSFISEIGAIAKDKGMKGVLNEQGQVKDLGVAIREALMKSGGNLQKLGGMGFSKPAQDFIVQYEGAYNEGLKKFGGSAEKAAAYATEGFEKMRTATMSEADVKRASARVMATSGEKMETAVNLIKTKLMGVMPQVKVFVDVLVSKAPAIASAALTLAQAMISCANVIAKMFPDTDTRQKRALKAATESAKIDVEIDKESQNMVAIGERLKNAKDIGLGVGDSTYDEALADQQASQAKIDALTAQKNQTESAATNAPTSKADRDALQTQLAGNADFIAQLGAMPQLAQEMGITQSNDAGQKASKFLSYMQKDTGFDIGEWAKDTNMSPETQAMLEKYRDSIIQQKEAAGGTGDSGAALLQPAGDSLKAAGDALVKSAAGLADAADKMTSGKEGPLGDK